MGLLHDLQSLNHADKTKVMIVASAIITIIVVFVWLSYFNGMMAGIAERSSGSAGAEDQTAVAQDTGPWDVIKNGFMGSVHAIGGIIQAPRQYIVDPQP